MSPRRLLRIVLSLAILVLLWTRVGREWHLRSFSWLAGSLTLSVLLVAVVLFELFSMRRKRRRPGDEVPKRPLGLDA
jgi:hypothetical protein